MINKIPISFKLGPAELRMEILVTDVTEMSGTNYCVAGWDATNKRMVRPLPGGGHWPQALIAKHGIQPGRCSRRNRRELLRARSHI